MSDSFEKIAKRALEIKDAYVKNEPKQWDVEQIFMGLVKDVGDLSKILMVRGGYRHDFGGDAKERLEHELADILYSIIVLADKVGIDLEDGFNKTMSEIGSEKRNKNGSYQDK